MQIRLYPGSSQLQRAWHSWSQKPADPLSKAAAVATQDKPDTHSEVKQADEEFGSEKVPYRSCISFASSLEKKVLRRKPAETEGILAHIYYLEPHDTISRYIIAHLVPILIVNG